MQCKYTYGRQHKDVKAGLAALGSLCKADATDERGFCYNHLEEQGLLSQEELAKRQADKERASLNRRVSARDSKVSAKGEDGRDGAYAPHILKAIKEFLTIPDFNLKEFFYQIGGIGIGVTDITYKRKFAYAHWLLADPETRSPSDHQGVAEILGVKEGYVSELSRGNRMEMFIRKAREEIVLNRGEPAYFAWMVDGVNVGDKDAIKAYEKLRERRAAVSDKPEEEIPEDTVAEAEEINKKPVKAESPVADAVGWGETDVD